MKKENSVTVTSTAIQILAPQEFKVEMSKAKTKLAEYVEENKNLSLDVSTPLNYSRVENAWRQYRTTRLDLKKKVDATYEDLKSQVASFKEEGDLIISQWQAEEDRLKEPLKLEDDRKKAEKALRAEAEKNRVKEGLQVISDLKLIPSKYILSSSVEIQDAINELTSKELKESDLLEFFEDAVSALNTSIDTLSIMRDSAKRNEELEEQLKARATEAELIQAAEAERLKAERQAFLDEQEAARAKQAELDLEAKKAADAKQAEINAENARKENKLRIQQQEINRQAREIREANERAARIEQEKLESAKREEQEKRRLAEENARKEAELAKLAEESKAEELNREKINAMSPTEAFRAILIRSDDDVVKKLCMAQLSVLTGMIIDEKGNRSVFDDVAQ